MRPLLKTTALTILMALPISLIAAPLPSSLCQTLQTWYAQFQPAQTSNSNFDLTVMFYNKDADATSLPQKLLLPPPPCAGNNLELGNWSQMCQAKDQWQYMDVSMVYQYSVSGVFGSVGNLAIPIAKTNVLPSSILCGQ